MPVQLLQKDRQMQVGKCRWFWQNKSTFVQSWRHLQAPGNPYVQVCLKRVEKNKRCTLYWAAFCFIRDAIVVIKFWP